LECEVCFVLSYTLKSAPNFSAVFTTYPFFLRSLNAVYFVGKFLSSLQNFFRSCSCDIGLFLKSRICILFVSVRKNASDME